MNYKGIELKMRAFITVLKNLIDLAEDKDLKESLNNVMADASFTAPEALWDIRGEQVTALLNDYLSNGTGRKTEWFAKVLAEYSTQPIEDIRKFQETLP